MESLVELWGKEGADILIRIAITDVEYANVRRKYYIMERLIAMAGKSNLGLKEKVAKIVELLDQKWIFVEEMKSVFKLREAYVERLKQIEESLLVA